MKGTNRPKGRTYIDDFLDHLMEWNPLSAQTISFIASKDQTVPGLHRKVLALAAAACWRTSRFHRSDEPDPCDTAREPALPVGGERFQATFPGMAGTRVWSCLLGRALAAAARAAATLGVSRQTCTVPDVTRRLA